MIDRREAAELINTLFEEEALLIGGLVAVGEIDDAFVWRLMKNLDVIRRKTLRRIGKSDVPRPEPERCPPLKPHPAIEDFLMGIRRERE